MTTFKDLVTHGRLDISILRQGPNDDIPTDLEHVKKYAEELPTKVRPTGGIPWPIFMTTKKSGALGPRNLKANKGYFWTLLAFNI